MQIERHGVRVTRHRWNLVEDKALGTGSRAKVARHVLTAKDFEAATVWVEDASGAAKLVRWAFLIIFRIDLCPADLLEDVRKHIENELVRRDKELAEG